MVWLVFGHIRHAVDVGDDYAVPSLADIERLCRRHDGAIYVLHQLGNAGRHDTPRLARLCLQLEPSARDYVGQLRGICVECAAELCVCLRQIRYACFGRRRLRRGNGGGILVQRIGFVALYRQRKILPSVWFDGKNRQTRFDGFQTDLENRLPHRLVLFSRSQRVFVYRLFGGAIRRGLCRRTTSRHQPVGYFVYGSAKRWLGKHGTRWLFARAARFFAGALYFRRVAGVGLDACCLHRAALGHLSLSVGRYVHQRCGRIRHCRDCFILCLPIPIGRCHPMYRFICAARL